MTTTTELSHTFHTTMGDYTVPASSPVPGLRVYQIPDEVEPLSGHRWSVGHHHGLVIAVAMYEDDAVRGAEKIADMADWTKPVEELRTEVDSDELYRRISWASCEYPAYA